MNNLAVTYFEQGPEDEAEKLKVQAMDSQHETGSGPFRQADEHGQPSSDLQDPRVDGIRQMEIGSRPSKHANPHEQPLSYM